MATKPTTLPRWAETAGGTPDANIATPSSGQLDTGWTVGQKPVPSNFQNWFQNLVYKWIAYLSDGLFTQATANTQAIRATGNGTGAGIEGIGGTTGPGGTFAHGTAATAGTRQSAVVVSNGDIDLSGVTNPTKTVGHSNKLGPANICKAWGVISNNTGSVATVEGFNIGSVAVSGIDTDMIAVTFGTGMADGNYVVVLQAVQTTGSSAHTPVVCGTRDAGAFTFALCDTTGAVINPTTYTGTVMFTVFGKQ